MSEEVQSNSFWRPIMVSKRLTHKPKRFMLEDKPIVLFRTANGVACLTDICPHRFAPLSEGRVVEGAIECPYHGWQFDGTGKCINIPLHEGPLPRRFVPAYVARESHGLIFVTENAEQAAPIHQPTWDDQRFVRHIMENETDGTLEDIIENGLDPIHTLFVHRGLLRGARKRTSKLNIDIAVENNVLTVTMTGEEGQDGLLSRLIEGERTRSHATFRKPGVLELVYWGPKNLNLVTTIYFTRMAGQRHRGFAVMTGPNLYGLGYLKALVFLPIMRKVLAQDCKLMREAYSNWQQFGKPIAAKSPLDIFRAGIEAVVEVRTLPEGTPTRLTLDI